MSEHHASTHQSLADEIASLSIKTYQALPAKCRPVIRSNGVPEWTILASIVLAIPRSSGSDQLADYHTNSGDPLEYSSKKLYDLQIVSLGTGMKCLPYNRLPPAGDTLHDQHAEVLARRGFRRWLLDQAMILSNDLKKGKDPSSGSVLEVATEGDIRLRPGVKVWMYVSTLPCGDASTTYTAAYQPITMANLKSRPVPSSSSRGPDRCEPALLPSPDPAVDQLRAPISKDQGATMQASSTARGRNDYTLTSSLRTKPGRPDSFPSISMSCSDKICAWSVVGLQGALLSNIRILKSAHCASSRSEEYGMAPGEEPRIGAGVDSSGQWHFAPVYLDGIVVGDVLPPGPETGGDLVGWHPDTETSGVKRDEVQVWSEKVRTFRQAVRKDAEWALSGRVAGIANSLSWPFRHVTPHMEFTDVPFPYSKLALSNPSLCSPSPALQTPSQPGRDAAPMINSLLHIPSTSTSPPITETLYQGADARQPWKAPGLVPLPGKRRSRVCKLEMMRDVLRLAGVRVEEEKGAMKGKKTELVRGGWENGMSIADDLAVTSAVQQVHQGIENVSLHTKQVAEEPGGRNRSTITYRQLKHSVFSAATLSIPPAPFDTDVSDAAQASPILGSAAYPSAKSTTPGTEDTIPDPSASPYQLVKCTLRGIPASPALVAGFERCGPLSISSAAWSTSVGAPFAGWLVSGLEYESFDHTGRGADLSAEADR